MKRLMMAFAVVAVVSFALRADVPRVIIDTDLGSSLDDLVAIDLAVREHRNGAVNLIGVMMDRPDGSNPHADPYGRGEFLKFADAYMTTLNMGDVPIGRAAKELNDVMVFTPYWTLIHSNDTVTGEALLRGSGRDICSFPDAVTLYRRLLDESPDKSVDICQIGFFGNLVKLMDSTDSFGDGIRKSGLELIREKVRTLRVMAGCFEGDGIAQGKHGEFNVWGDIESARRVFGGWPGKIVCSPWEVGIKLVYEPDWMRADFPYGCHNNVLHAFDLYWHDPADGDEFPNRLWDVMTVLGVVREDRVSLSPCGTIDVENVTGITRFTQQSDGSRRYQYLESTAEAQSLMDDIRVIVGDGRSSETWPVGENVLAYTNAEGVLKFVGTGAMSNFVSAADVPWDPAKVKAVSIDGGVTKVGANAWAGLEDSVRINGTALSAVKFLGPGVSSAELSGAISPAEFERIDIVDGKAYLGVAVLTSDTVTNRNWSVATNGVIEVPAPGKAGFFILQSKAAADTLHPPIAIIETR